MNEDLFFLRDICDRLGQIEIYTQGGKSEFLNVRLKKTINKRRLLEIMEAASQQAIAKGMTPEFLESILNDDD
ncbi:MAG TPA: hypothetical protein IGS52_02690 [Oscillatoriaceae cyanobacterium M33_DOE_052]|uniref:Uncharacterized protein n=1 Tax=Planktothricoides sp. SpSt-374 TaxID=2282167 RepID=A0A7C3VSZ8_9CYAN|nr:hypothetical protein [Oscillatoriaceae cyanobacterium M33_DOE_052]